MAHKLSISSPSWSSDLASKLAGLDEQVVSNASGKGMNINAGGRRVRSSQPIVNRGNVQNSVSDDNVLAGNLYLLRDGNGRIIDTKSGVIAYSTDGGAYRVTQEGIGEIVMLSYPQTEYAWSPYLFISDGRGGVYAYDSVSGTKLLSHAPDGINFGAIKTSQFSIGSSLLFEVKGVFYHRNMTSTDMLNWVSFTPAALHDYSWAIHNDDVYVISADYQSVLRVNNGVLVQTIDVSETATGVSGFSVRGVVADNDQLLLFALDGRIISFSNNAFTLLVYNVGQCEYLYSIKSEQGYFIITHERLFFSADLIKFHVVVDQSSDYLGVDIKIFETLIYPIYFLGHPFAKNGWPIMFSTSHYVLALNF